MLVYLHHGRPQNLFLILITRLQLLGDDIILYFFVVLRHHGIVHVGVENLAQCGDLFESLAFQRVGELFCHHFYPVVKGCGTGLDVYKRQLLYK